MRLGCRSVAMTYNDPVIFLEYAVDVADACRARGIKAVAVTAGYIGDEPRRELFAHVDAANVDLKAFTEDFYHRVSAGHLQPVLDTLIYLRRCTDVWFEITTLLIPGQNDSDAEIDADARGSPTTSAATSRCTSPRSIPTSRCATWPAHRRRRCTGRGTSPCGTGCATSTPATCTTSRADGPSAPAAERVAVQRDWYVIGRYELTDDGHCVGCGTPIPGRYDGPVGRWGSRRVPVSIAEVGGSHAMKLRPAAVAGRFYPADPVELATSVDAVLAAARPIGRRPVALIARMPATGTRERSRVPPMPSSPAAARR